MSQSLGILLPKPPLRPPIKGFRTTLGRYITDFAEDKGKGAWEGNSLRMVSILKGQRPGRFHPACIRFSNYNFGGVVFAFWIAKMIATQGHL